MWASRREGIVWLIGFVLLVFAPFWIATGFCMFFFGMWLQQRMDRGAQR